jgi:hypothetical protein
MNTRINAAAYILAGIILVPCLHASDRKQHDCDSDLAVAEKAAAELMITMKNELQAAMQNGGPVGAVGICSTRAQILTTEIPARIGRPDIAIKRTSLKFRNPANRPTHEEELILQLFTEQLKQGIKLQPLTKKTKKILRYYYPLQTAPLCLNCHGKPEDLNPEVRALLQRYYPQDKATGFAAGDLRGMIRITVPTGSQ